MTPPPDGAPIWFWLVGLVIVFGVPALCGVVVALINRPVRRALREQNQHLSRAHQVQEQVREQVQNSHTTNLRDDLDALTGAVVDLSTEVRSGNAVGRQTRAEVRRLSRRVRTVESRVDEHHPDTD